MRLLTREEAVDEAVREGLERWDYRNNRDILDASLPYVPAMLHNYIRQAWFDQHA